MPHVAALLPQNQVKMSKNAFLYVRTSTMENVVKTALFTREKPLFRGCAPGVTRTLDLRIRNPLLYPAELRAQLRSEVAASEYDVQVFPGSVR